MHSQLSGAPGAGSLPSCFLSSKELGIDRVTANLSMLLLCKVDSGHTYVGTYFHSHDSTFDNKGIYFKSMALTSYTENMTLEVHPELATFNFMVKVWDPGLLFATREAVHVFSLSAIWANGLVATSIFYMHAQNGEMCSAEMLYAKTVQEDEQVVVLALTAIGRRLCGKCTLTNCGLELADWIVNVHPYFHSSTDFVDHISFSDLPFDPGGVHQEMKHQTYSDNEHPKAAKVLFKGMCNARRRTLVSGYCVGVVASLLHCENFIFLFPSGTNVKSLSDDGYWIIVKATTTTSYPIMQAEVFVVLLMHDLTMSWSINVINQQLQVKITVERSPSHHIMDVVAKIRKSTSFVGNIRHPLLQGVQLGLDQILCDKLDGNMTSLTVDLLKFPFDPGGHLNFQLTFNMKRSVSLYLNLEDKVLIERGGIVMNISKAKRAIGPRASNRAIRHSPRLIWDPGPIRNLLKRTKL